MSSFSGSVQDPGLYFCLGRLAKSQREVLNKPATIGPAAIFPRSERPDAERVLSLWTVHVRSMPKNLYVRKCIGQRAGCIEVWVAFRNWKQYNYE